MVFSEIQVVHQLILDMARRFVREVMPMRAKRADSPRRVYVGWALHDTTCPLRSLFGAADKNPTLSDGHIPRQETGEAA